MTRRRGHRARLFATPLAFVGMANDDDLTPYERRLTLGALWHSKAKAVDGLSARSEDDDDALHVQETGEAYDSAARKLGGDPEKDLYGAPEFG